jgi:hypothetical protein
MAEYIKREVLSEIMNDIAEDETCPMNIAADIYQAVDCISTADVEPVRHGHWEEAIRARRSIAGKIEDFRCYKCSACSKSSFYKTDYCPNCGAKMAEEGQNENSNTNTTRLL